jgi:hypothetical protein
VEACDRFDKICLLSFFLNKISRKSLTILDNTFIDNSTNIQLYNNNKFIDIMTLRTHLWRKYEHYNIKLILNVFKITSKFRAILLIIITIIFVLYKVNISKGGWAYWHCCAIERNSSFLNQINTLRKSVNLFIDKLDPVFLSTDLSIKTIMNDVFSSKTMINQLMNFIKIINNILIKHHNINKKEWYPIYQQNHRML